MILLDVLPCANCTHCQGIAQPDGTEQSEYIVCDIASENNALNLLQGVKCEKTQPMDDDL